MKITPICLSKILIPLIIFLFSFQSFAQCDLDPVFRYEQRCDTMLFINETDTLGSGLNFTDFYWIVNAVTYHQWDSLEIVFAIEGTYNAELTLEYDPGCATSINEDVYYYSSTIDYSYILGCPGSETSFYDETEIFNIGIDIYPEEWFWDFGNGFQSTDQNPTTVYDDYGTYDIFYSLKNNLGCESYVNEPISLNPIEIDFTYQQFCDSVFFRNLTDTVGLEIDSVVWEFGHNGAKSYMFDSVSYIYPENGFFIVDLNIYTTYCDTFMTDTVYVYNQTPSFDYIKNCTPNLSHFFGDADTIEIHDTSFFPVNLYWDLGFGTLNQGEYDTSYAYITGGDYFIRFMTENSIGCFDTISELISIDTIGIDFTWTEPVCKIVEFENLSDTNNIQYDSVYWDFGDGFNSSAYNNVSHEYGNGGEYIVELIVYYGDACNNVINKPITVDFPTSSFDFSHLGTNLVSFTNTSTVYLSPIISYYWDFGDATFSTDESPIHSYTSAGEFEVCLTVTNDIGCLDVFCQTIYITPCPDIDFTYISDATLFTEFFDQSVANTDYDPNNYITSWLWDFGDGNTSTEQNPTHTYAQSIDYTVTLEVCDAHETCCSEMKTIFAGRPIILDDINISGLCLGETASFSNNYSLFGGVDNLEWYWDFGDGTDTTYNEYAPVIEHDYSVGTYFIEFILSGDQGGIYVGDTIHDTINIYSLPDVLIRSDSVCLGEYIQFYDLTDAHGDNIVSRFWTFGDGGTSTNNHPSYLYADTGTYQVTLEIETENGCVGNDTTVAKVNIAPVIDELFIEHACLHAPTFFFVTYDTTSTYVSTFIWHWGPYTYDTTYVPYISHVYDVIQVNYMYLAAYSGGCFDTIGSGPFLVFPTPSTDFNPVSDYEGVTGQVYFDNLSVDPSLAEGGDLISYWDFGNGNTSNEMSPIEVYEEDGIYNVTLVSTNDYGCTDTIVKQHEVYFRGLFVPTAFSPNNANEDMAYFYPKGYNLASYHMEVFDMKGNLLWESTALDEFGTPTEWWDGYYNGQLMPQGTYIWKAEASFGDGTRWKGSTFQGEDPKPYGTVTLVK